MLPVSIEILHSLYKECKQTICTDSRNILPGSMFFCLKGPTFNGNHFAADALEKGAAYVVVDEVEFSGSEKAILVLDVLETLQELARFHRESITTHILAVGGSNGKTTTKELCLAVLSTSKKTLATRGNLNNHIGVPLTLLELTGNEDYAIIETGTNHSGEMRVLCDIVQANSGIVTNVGKEHLEGFGSLEEVAREESELFQSLIPSNGLAYVNADDPWLSNMSKRLRNTFTYGIDNHADLRGKVVESMPFLTYELNYLGKKHGPYTAQIGGDFNLYNILAALAVGLTAGITIPDAAAAIQKYQPSNNRSEWRKTEKYQILLDAYNANPSSVEVALQSFAKIPGKKAIMLGDMLELGEHSTREHKYIAELAEALDFDEKYYCGKEFSAVTGANSMRFDSVELLNQWLTLHPCKAQYVLIKGSRGLRMEKTLEVLALATAD